MKSHYDIILKTVSEASFFINFDYKMSTRILYVDIK